ncbi:hypothetical protein BROUX41_004217 [Berkeleyomyces rouxiae]|uniref:uncharacterized protein n=1 Tax=Berkeleyomyces rouxiae TaxID=2035830 RepID=UPI003B7C97D5
MTMSLVKAPSNLPALVSAAFAQARASNDLTFFPTQAAVLSTAYGPVQLRYAPSLAHKPKGPPRAAGSPPIDPFADPPAPLRIATLAPAHILVLNKFAIAPEHFILATSAWRSQEDVLEEADIAAAHACVQAYRGQEGGNTGDTATGPGTQDSPPVCHTGLFVFFNGGPHSGASQPHCHLQLIPVSSLHDGLPAAPAWVPLIDSILCATSGAPGLPCRVFAQPIPAGASGKELFETYLALYAQACRAVLGEGVEVPREGRALVSYNFAMTESTMAVCPRVAEGAEICVQNGQGKLQLNGTLLAGTALVKSESEWDALRQDPRLFENVLSKIGVPKENEVAEKN